MYIHICLLYIEDLHGNIYKKLINDVICRDRFLGDFSVDYIFIFVVVKACKYKREIFLKRC